ncbi:MAG: desulfoferrodoxin family protein [Myxococcota bacterium]|nr:desulfoferrodoxin family protein [Myxococcota bacterium]
MSQISKPLDRRELFAILGKVGISLPLLSACTDVTVNIPPYERNDDDLGALLPTPFGEDQGLPGGGRTPSPTQELGTLERIAAWEESEILTPSAPGMWGDKIVDHFPLVTAEGPRVDVLVPHPMEEDHFIEAIYLRDSSGQVIAYQALSPLNEFAFGSFWVDDPADCTAYAVCNLHQVWSASLVRSPAAPGPWVDQINGHTPRVEITDEQVTVVVPHPMEEEHYIVGLYLSDQDGQLIDQVQLTPGAEALHSFSIPEGVSEVTAWALCDDHDLWVGQPVSLSFAERMSSWESSTALTADEPSVWGEKIADHYPVALLAGSSLNVTVHHPMTDEHYIEAIYLRDEAGHFIDYRELSPGDKPTATFELLSAEEEYLVYAVCNLHELWVAPIIRSAARPGPWPDKVEPHTPIVELGPAGVTVTVPHPMEEEHRIVAIYLLDQNNELIGFNQLNPQQLEASATFELTPEVLSVQPLALCDDHDLWSGEALVL